MSGAVARWLVRATDDRVVTASNLSVAASMLGALACASSFTPHCLCLSETQFVYVVLLSRILSGLANFSTEQSEPCRITL